MPPSKPNAASDVPVARHIRAIASAEGITLAKMAKRLGLSPSFLSAVCKGRKHLSEELTYRIYRVWDAASDTELAAAAMLARMNRQDVDLLISRLSHTKKVAALLALAEDPY